MSSLHSWVMFKQDLYALVAKYLPEAVKRNILYELQRRVVVDPKYMETPGYWDKNCYDVTFTEMLQRIK